jgi:probable phosphoglycerate mutase
MSVTRIFLVRHGSTTLTAEDRFAGETDVALADDGREQARRLATRLCSQPIAAICASPLQRCAETARLLAQPHELAIQTRPEFREMSHGHWEGLKRSDVEAKYPDEFAAWQNDPYTFAPRGGESGLAVTARALPALLEVVRACAGKSVIIVSHKATIRLLISSLLGFDSRRYRDNLDQSPAALNILDFKESHRARLTLFNDTSHYSESGLAIPSVPEHRLSKWWDSTR